LEIVLELEGEHFSVDPLEPILVKSWMPYCYKLFSQLKENLLPFFFEWKFLLDGKKFFLKPTLDRPQHI